MRIECPSCAGEVAIQPGNRFVRCDYCESLLHIDLGESLVKKMYRRTVDERQIPGILRKVFQSHDLEMQFEILAMELLYFPYWRFEFRHSSAVTPAAAIPVQAMARYQPRSGNQEFFDGTVSGNARIVALDIFMDTALSEVLEGRNPAEADWIRPVIEYVPFYAVTYLYGRSEYRLHIDAHDATVLEEELPVPPLFMKNSSMAFTALVIFLAYLLTTSIMIISTGSVSLAILACLALTFLFHKWLKRMYVED